MAQFGDAKTKVITTINRFGETVQLFKQIAPLDRQTQQKVSHLSFAYSIIAFFKVMCACVCMFSLPKQNGIFLKHFTH